VVARTAHGQLKSSIDLATLNKTLRTRYDRKRYRRERFRERLISRIEEGWKETGPGTRIRAIFDYFKQSVDATVVEDHEEQRSLALVVRAIMELLGNPNGDVSPTDLADALRHLVLAIRATETTPMTKRVVSWLTKSRRQRRTFRQYERNNLLWTVVAQDSSCGLLRIVST
jgi:hypothetical protein